MDNEPQNPMTDPAGAAAPEFEPAPAASVPPARAYPQLYRFLFGGILVAVGTLLPFGPKLVATLFDPAEFETAAAAAPRTDQEKLRLLAESLESGAPITTGADVEAAPEFFVAGRQGIETMTGALILLVAIYLIAQMWGAIRDRKVVLGGVLAMLIPFFWSWFKMITVSSDLAWFSWGSIYKVSTLEHLALDIGTGFVLVLLGSTYVAWTFLRALFGAAKASPKNAGTPAAASRTSRAGGARSRR